MSRLNRWRWRYKSNTNIPASIAVLCFFLMYSCNKSCSKSYNKSCSKSCNIREKIDMEKVIVPRGCKENATRLTISVMTGRHPRTLTGDESHSLRKSNPPGSALPRECYEGSVAPWVSNVRERLTFSLVPDITWYEKQVTERCRLRLVQYKHDCSQYGETIFANAHREPQAVLSTLRSIRNAGCWRNRDIVVLPPLFLLSKQLPKLCYYQHIVYFTSGAGMVYPVLEKPTTRSRETELRIYNPRHFEELTRNHQVIIPFNRQDSLRPEVRLYLV